MLTGCNIPGINPIAAMPAADTTCTADSIRIQVADGLFRILCGCTGAGEEAGTVFPPPGGLTCHAAQSPATVTFYFVGTFTRHQIVSTGNNTFPPSPVITPDDNPLPAYSVVLTTASGSYDFSDSFSGMTGQIFVP
jgi:hypothetical protein